MVFREYFLGGILERDFREGTGMFTPQLGSSGMEMV